MINLRYHIVSLVAVFFALVIGVVAGTTVIDQQLVEALEGRTNSLQVARDRLEADKTALEQEIALWERFGETFVPDLVSGRLQGHNVVIVAQDGLDGDQLERVIDVVEAAGAQVAGRIAFKDRWLLNDKPTREQLGLTLANDSDDPETLLRDAAARIAARLTAGGDPAAETDLLRALDRTGFLAVEGVGAGSFPPRDAAVVIVTADTDEAQPRAESFLIPFLQALQDRFPLAVTQTLRAREPVVETVRRDRLLTGTVSTIDDLDSLLGELSLVYALIAEVAGGNAVHYGVRDGATSVAPRLER